MLATPGRSVPWVNDTFSYKIRGGLEPGEKITWELAPNMFGEWSKAPKNRNDMVLTVSVISIYGANDETIYEVDFSERDNDRLRKLKKWLKENKK